MAILGLDDILRSLLIPVLLLYSGDIWAGSTPVEGKRASKSRSRRKQERVRGTRAGRLVAKGGGPPHGAASRQDGDERKDIGLGNDIPLLCVRDPVRS